MEHIEYKIEIAAPKKTVWESMIQAETYKQWAGKAWPGSSYQGTWAQGEMVRFVGPDQSGTLAEVVEMNPYENVFMKHVAALDKGKEDRTSEVAKGWIGTTEGYTFEEKRGKTTVKVSIETTPEWRKVFDDSWPGALEELKRVAEQQLASA